MKIELEEIEPQLKSNKQCTNTMAYNKLYMVAIRQPYQLVL